MGTYAYDESFSKIEVIPKSVFVGALFPYAGDTAPDGFLLCDGQAVSRTTYKDLFNVIGTKYGSGDGSTTFNIPNTKGRTLVGLDTGDTDFATLGKTGGTKTVTLTIDQIPSHNHSASTTVNSGGAHVHSASSSSAGSHGHTASASTHSGHTHVIATTGLEVTGPGSVSWGRVVTGTQSDAKTESAGSHAHTITVASNGAHSHTITVNSGGAHSHTATTTIGSTGGGKAHNNLQPYLTVNYIIKY